MFLGFKTKPLSINEDQQTAIDLKQWATLSWFYDEGFDQQAFRENDNSFNVIGRNQVYKFIKPKIFKDSGDALGFYEAWMDAVQEIQDHKILCPDLYLGMKMIGVRDGEPFWMNSEPQLEIDAEYPPTGAHSVAVISRRVDINKNLKSLIDSRTHNFDDYLERSCKLLAAFHRYQVKKAFHICSISWLDDLKLYLNELFFHLKNKARLGSPSHLIICHLESYVNAFIENNVSGFYDRIEQNLVTDVHGAVKCGNIVFELAEYKLGRPGIINRIKRNESLRVNDILYDIAYLTVDLASKGEFRKAKSAVEFYKNSSKYFDAKFLNFYQILASLVQCRNLLERDESWAPVSKILGNCFACTEKLDQPRLILVSGSKTAFKSHFTKALGLFTGARTLHLKPTNNSKYAALSSQTYTHCRDLLRRGSRVVVESPRIFADLDYELRLLAKKRNIPYVAIKIHNFQVEILSMCNLLGSPTPQLKNSYLSQGLPQANHSESSMSEMARNVQLANSKAKDLLRIFS